LPAVFLVNMPNGLGPCVEAWAAHSARASLQGWCMQEAHRPPLPHRARSRGAGHCAVTCAHVLATGRTSTGATCGTTWTPCARTAATATAAPTPTRSCACTSAGGAWTTRPRRCAPRATPTPSPPRSASARLSPAPAVSARSNRCGCGVYSQQPLRLRCLLAAAAAAARTRTPSLALGTADRAAQPQGKLGQEERQALVAAGKQLKEQLAAAEAAAAGAEQALQREGQRLPNLTHPEARGPPARSLWSGTHHQ